MSTTAMWLLLAVVVILIVFGSVLYKRTFTVHELALTGVMAALSLVAYLFFRVPFYGGSSFHLGNTFTALTALLLDADGINYSSDVELVQVSADACVTAGISDSSQVALTSIRSAVKMVFTREDSFSISCCFFSSKCSS